MIDLEPLNLKADEEELDDHLCDLFELDYFYDLVDEEVIL